MLALKPLAERFGIESIFVSTMQAVSGAGYPGVPSLDILGNVVPFIKNEEEKMEAETMKLLGTLEARGCAPTRAMRRIATVSPWKTATPRASPSSCGVPATREQMLAAWQRDSSPSPGSTCPPPLRSPSNSLPWRIARSRVSTACAATAWPLRSAACAPAVCLDWKFTVLSHNTIRGAAGAALLNAEMLTPWANSCRSGEHCDGSDTVAVSA